VAFREFGNLDRVEKGNRLTGRVAEEGHRKRFPKRKRTEGKKRSCSRQKPSSTLHWGGGLATNAIIGGWQGPKRGRSYKD